MVRFSKILGLVLKKTPVRDKDLSLKVLTDKGFLDCKVRGIRTPGHHFGTNVDLFYKYQFDLYKKPNSSYYTVTGIKFISLYRFIPENLYKFTLISTIADFINCNFYESENYPDMLIMLISTMEFMEEDEKPIILFCWFFIKLLSLMGIAISGQCIKCGRKDFTKDDKIYFSYDKGSFVCCLNPQPSKASKKTIQIPYFAVKIINFISENNSYLALREKCVILKKQIEIEILKTTIVLIEYHSSKKLVSIDFLKNQFDI